MAGDRRISPEQRSAVASRAQRLGRRAGRRTLRSRGAAAVEFALVAPVFFLVVIGMIEVGRALMVQQALTNASRAGAREAALLATSQEAVLAMVHQYAANMGIVGADATVSPNPASAVAGTEITVVASIGFNEVSWLPTPWILGGATLSASTTMRKEGF
jgi:Flp pilus assembly protein TadG